MRTPPMDTDKLRDWILRRLGAPILRVELDKCHVEDAINTATHWFSAKKGVKKQIAMGVVSGQVAYDLPEYVDVVLDVIFPQSGLDSPTDSFVVPFFTPYDVFTTSMRGGDYATVTQAMQHVGMVKRLLSAEPDWRQEGRKLFLFPAGMTGVVVLDAKVNQFTIDQLSERDHDLVKRYALARAKEDLGRIRSKYSEYPTAQGSTSLDGSTLLEEARAEIEALEEEIMLSGYPMGVVVG